MRHVIKYCRWCHRQELWRHNLYFKRPRVAIFADIIKIITMFIKRIFKDSKNVKRIRNYVSRFNLYLYFLIYQNLLISGEKSLISAEPKVCVTWFMYFLNHLLLRYECAKFHHYMMYVTDFLGRGWPFCHSPPPHIREQPQKGPSWIGLKGAQKTLKQISGQQVICLLWKVLQRLRGQKQPLEVFYKKCF